MGPVEPMPTAVALVTEALRPNGGDYRVINALLADVPAEQMPVVVAATAVVASRLGHEWSTHNAAGPGELLACIGLAAARRSA